MRRSSSAVFGLLTVSLAAGCDFGGSNTPPPEEPDLTLDGAPPDAPAATPDAQIGTMDAAAEASPGAADAGVEGPAADAPFEAAASEVAEGGPSAPVEAGVDATVEAGVDAGIDSGSDTGVDTTSPDAGDGGLLPVTVAISGPAGLEMGIPIVFHDPSGAQIAIVNTDSAGKASRVVPPGSFVTALFGPAPQPELVTIAGVQPGDAIPITDPTRGLNEEGTVTIQGPAPLAGSTRTDVMVGDDCSAILSSEGNAASLELDSPCVGPGGTFPILLLAIDQSSIIGYAFDDDVPFNADGTISVAGPYSSTLGTETVETTGVDPVVVPRLATVRQIADGVSFTQSNTVSVQEDESTQAVFTIEPGLATAMQTEVDLRSDDDTVIMALASQEAPPSVSGTHSYDLTQLPPAVTGSSIDTTNALQPVVAWTSNSPLANGSSAIVVDISWNVTSDSPQTGVWILVVPAGAANAVPPVLTGDAAPFGPPGEGPLYWSQTVEVTAIGGTLAPSYDAMRALVGQIYVPIINQNFPLIPALPAAGTLTASSLFLDL
jgi:hypothetical protein